MRRRAPPSEAAETIEEQIRERARGQGFAVVRFARPDLPVRNRDAYDGFIDAGRHGTMAWLAERAAFRREPRALWAEVRSVIVLAASYAPAENPLPELERRERGVIALYARRRDYHEVMKKRLKAIARWLAEGHGAAVKVFVDTAPVLEKPLAERAGLGWQGKHTNLVSRKHGSWLLLGEIFTDLALAADPPEADHCGRCRRCLDVCPTDAFPAPYQLDARRCISYLTIEHKGHIAKEFRPAMGNRIFGCDDCLAVCPWNKFARAASDVRLACRDELTTPRLADLARLDDAAFRARFAGTPIKRTGRDRFVRNVLIAIGNSGERGLASVVEPLLDDPSPLVRAMAVWALGRLLPATDFSALRDRHQRAERDPAVRVEWAEAA